MARFVALLRGINVGQAQRVAMADLRALLQALGYQQVRTLLNSGNAVFDGRAEPAARHASRIQAALARTLGVQVRVIVKSARDIAAIVADNPLLARATEPSRLLVAFTHEAATLAVIQARAAGGWGDEASHVGAHAAYLWCPQGLLDSPLAVTLLKGLGDGVTTRNWSTVEKIHALLQAKI